MEDADFVVNRLIFRQSYRPWNLKYYTCIKSAVLCIHMGLMNETHICIFGNRGKLSALYSLFTVQIVREYRGVMKTVFAFASSSKNLLSRKKNRADVNRLRDLFCMCYNRTIVNGLKYRTLCQEEYTMTNEFLYFKKNLAQCRGNL
jgi:hypothetical protein